MEKKNERKQHKLAMLELLAFFYYSIIQKSNNIRSLSTSCL